MRRLTTTNRIGSEDVSSLAKMPHSSRMGKYKMTFNFNPAIFKILLKYLKPKKGEEILDLGCSRGFYVREMENYSDGVVGIDISKASLEEALTNTF